MERLRGFGQVLLATAAATALVAAGVGVLLWLQAWLSPTPLLRPAAALPTGCVAALAFGAGPALLVGAPAYWWLWRRGHAGWRTALPLGLASGSLVAVLEPALAAWGAGCGAIAAGLVHAALQRAVADAAAPASDHRDRLGVGAPERDLR